jgi:hypothetical protein
MNKLESLYKRTTGVNPKKIEPRLSGLQMQKEICRVKYNQPTNLTNLNDPIFQSSLECENPWTLKTDKYFYAFESGSCEIVSEPYTVIRRASFINGEETVEAAFIFGSTFEPIDYTKAINMVHPDDWIPLDKLVY